MLRELSARIGADRSARSRAVAFGWTLADPALTDQAFDEGVNETDGIIGADLIVERLGGVASFRSREYAPCQILARQQRKRNPQT